MSWFRLVGIVAAMVTLLWLGQDLQHTISPVPVLSGLAVTIILSALLFVRGSGR